MGAAVDAGAAVSMPDALYGDVRGDNGGGGGGGGGGVGNLKAPVPKATSIRSRYRFLSRSPDDMTIKEIPALLKDYQQLVVRNSVVFSCSSTTVTLPPHHPATLPPPCQFMTPPPHQPASIFASSCSQSVSPSLQRRVHSGKARSRGVARRPQGPDEECPPATCHAPAARTQGLDASHGARGREQSPHQKLRCSHRTCVCWKCNQSGPSELQ